METCGGSEAGGVCMKWFKHEDTFNNPKIEMLTDKHGIAGYGVYFRTLELIAKAIEESNVDEWGYLPEFYTNQYLAKKLQVSEEDLREIFNSCVILNLFELRGERVFCQKVLERCDDYTQRLLNQSKKKVGTKSEESPTKNRIDKKRIEEEVDKKENKNINIAKAIEAKPQYGNQDINSLVDHFLEAFKLPTEDCTQTQSRQYWNLLLKESKTGVDGVKWLIDLASKDEFYRNNITSGKDLYYKRVKLVARKRGDSPLIAVMGGQNG